MKINFKTTLKTILVAFLFLIVALNFYEVFTNKDPFIDIKTEASSKNTGQSYSGKLKFWYFLAQNGDWDSAAKIEKFLDPVDVVNYKIQNDPQELQKKLNVLTSKANKTPDDWVKLAQIQSMLGNFNDVKKSIDEAYRLDPIRDDINKLYFSFQK